MQNTPAQKMGEIFNTEFKTEYPRLKKWEKPRHECNCYILKQNIGRPLLEVFPLKENFCQVRDLDCLIINIARIANAVQCRS